jgi:hypothetical protein
MEALIEKLESLKKIIEEAELVIKAIQGAQEAAPAEQTAHPETADPQAPAA